jgi:hypothetical protein
MVTSKYTSRVLLVILSHFLNLYQKDVFTRLILLQQRGETFKLKKRFIEVEEVSQYIKDKRYNEPSAIIDYCCICTLVTLGED